MNTQRTYMHKDINTQKEWFLIDCTNQVLGRLATEVAKLLRGKQKSIYTPHVDCGDKIILVNAEKIKLTGNKIKNKKYYKHSGYIGGLKTKTAENMLELQPEKMVAQAIFGMLPHNKLGRKQKKNLYVYKGGKHIHHSQQPKKITLNIK